MKTKQKQHMNHHKGKKTDVLRIEAGVFKYYVCSFYFS